MKKIIFFVVFGIFLSGCQFAGFISPIVTGVIIWKEGRAYKYYDLDEDVMYKAIKRTLKESSIRIIEDKYTRFGRHIQAQGRDAFSFYIKNMNHGTTEVSLRINTFGNKSYCEMVFSQIDENTGLVEYNQAGKSPTNLSTAISSD